MENAAFRAHVREVYELMVAAAVAKRAGNMMATAVFAQQLLAEAERAGLKATCIAACSALETMGHFPPEAIEAARVEETHLN